MRHSTNEWRPRPDQVRDRDKIRRACIEADIDDLGVEITPYRGFVHLFLTEPGDETPHMFSGGPKFDFRMTNVAFRKLARRLREEEKGLKD